MKANKNLFISARVDKETKEWIDNHPLGTTGLINYGLYLIRMMERNIKDANTYMSTVTIEPASPEKLPF